MNGKILYGGWFVTSDFKDFVFCTRLLLLLWNLNIYSDAIDVQRYTSLDAQGGRVLDRVRLETSVGSFRSRRVS